MRLDRTGKTYGRLTVIRPDKISGRHLRWICRCSCGVEKSIQGGNLTSGNIQSCGCLVRENAAARAYRHGHTAGKPNGTPEYAAWRRIIRRCSNKKRKTWHRYGGRGIKVCDRWINDFKAFLADMGQPPSSLHTIDRIDNDGNYEPNNCRWATQKEQARNKSTNKFVSVNGEKLIVQDAAKIIGIPSGIIYQRLSRGWDEQRALTTPVHHKQRRSKDLAASI